MVKLPEIAIDFDEENHVYSLRGMRLPSVTQLMRPMTTMVYGDVSPSTLNAAADRGTRVHQSVENIVKYGVEEWDEDTELYVMAFQQFQRDYGKKWLGSEYRVYHKIMNYAGTIDLIAQAGDDAVDVIDIKTTTAFHGILLSCQLSAYAEALRSHGVNVHEIYGLQLLNNGTYRFERVDYDYKLFMHSMALCNAMAKAGY